MSASPSSQAVEQHPVLVVPGLYVAEDATLDWLKAYAHAGGHLVLGPRTGYGDDEARARADVQPGASPTPPERGTRSPPTCWTTCR